MSFTTGGHPAPLGLLPGRCSHRGVKHCRFWLASLPQAQCLLAGTPVLGVADHCAEMAECTGASGRQGCSQLLEGGIENSGVEHAQALRNAVEQAKRFDPRLHTAGSRQATVRDDPLQPGGGVRQRVAGQSLDCLESCGSTILGSDGVGSERAAPGAGLRGDNQPAQSHERSQVFPGLPESESSSR